MSAPGLKRTQRLSRVLLGLAWCLLAVSGASARPNETIAGSVTDPEGNPLPGVSISIVGQPNDPTLTVTTNKKGRFFFGLVKSDYPYTLKVEMEGMAVERFTASAVDDEKRPRYDFTQRPKVDEPLREITVPVAGAATVELVLAPSERVLEAQLGPRLVPVAEQIDRGAYGEALEALDEILAEMPNNPTALYLKGFALLRSGDPEGALGLLQQAAEAKPDLAGVHAAVGAALAELGRYQEAESSFAREAEGQADLRTRVNALVGQADAARERGDDRAALAALEKAVALDPERGELYSMMADYHGRLGEPEKAKVAMARAEALGGGEPTTLYNMAARYMNTGDYEEAIEHFRRALALDPSLTQSHYHMGIALINLQRVDEARDQLHAFLGTEPAGPEADNARAILEMLEPSGSDS